MRILKLPPEVNRRVLSRLAVTPKPSLGGAHDHKSAGVWLIDLNALIKRFWKCFTIQIIPATFPGLGIIAKFGKLSSRFPNLRTRRRNFFYDSPLPGGWLGVLKLHISEVSWYGCSMSKF
jgi:hypothetical protein